MAEGRQTIEGITKAMVKILNDQKVSSDIIRESVSFLNDAVLLARSEARVKAGEMVKQFVEKQFLSQ